MRNVKGKSIDITMPVEEGEQYHLGGITFTGNKRVTNVKALRALFKLKDGQIFDASLVGKGLENMRKAYGQLGYINFTAVPTPRIDEAKKLVYLNIDIDEGKPYYVSRIEFRGNTTTRDNVIRRELLLEEGQIYNSHLWEMSLLRLNQLSYFNPLKVDQDSETQQDADNGTVNLLLNVKEKGKNSIGLNGGFSGLSGAFVGLNYQTNNFLGLGESLTLQAALGNLQRNLTFGMTIPYVKNHPLSLGFQITTQKSQYNAYKNPLSLTGKSENFDTAQQSFVQNYDQAKTGVSVSANYPIPRTFKRIGATYSLNRSNIQAFSPATTNLFQYLNFRHGTTGQSALNGIITSQLSLSYSYSTVGNPYRPRDWQEPERHPAGLGTGRQCQLHQSAGGIQVLQADLMDCTSIRKAATFSDTVSRRPIFRASPDWWLRPLTASMAVVKTMYAASMCVLSTPYGLVPTKVLYNLTNADGTLVPRDPTNPYPRSGDGSAAGLLGRAYRRRHPDHQQYRIPHPHRGSGGLLILRRLWPDMALNHSQLQLNPQANSNLNGALYGCPATGEWHLSGRHYLDGTGGHRSPRALAQSPAPNRSPRLRSGRSLPPCCRSSMRRYGSILPSIQTVCTRT